MRVKKCTKCNFKYPATTEYFSPDKRKSLGIASQCRQCKRKLDREDKQRRRDNPVTNGIDKARVRQYQKRKRIERYSGNKTDIYYSSCAGCGFTYVVNDKRKEYCCPHCEPKLKPINITYKNCVDCGKLESMKLWGAVKWERCVECKKKRRKELWKKHKQTEKYKNYRRKYKRDNGFSNHRQRARHYGVYYEPVSKKKVFKRDKYRCSVCGCKCNKVNNDPKQATLGHIIALSIGGAHTYSNVRTECRSCNMKRGTDCEGEQVTLFTYL